MNTQSRGKTNEKGNNSRNQKESQRGRGLNQEDQKIASTMGKQGIRRKIVEIERTMKE